MTATSVFVAESSPRYRERIVAAIRARRDLRLVGEAANGRDALAAIERLQPQIATVPVRLPGLSGLEVVRALGERGVETRVLVLGEALDDATVTDAFDAGACGYVWKGTELDVIADAVAACARGATVLGPRVRAELVTELQGRQHELTARETEVLALIADGRSAAEIGERLGLSVPTVKTYLRRIYRKLGVNDRAAAVAQAMRRGLLA